MSKYSPDSSTLQSKFGFQDEDLKTQKHDEIILWLDENMKEIVYKILDIKEEEWDSILVNNLIQEATNHMNERVSAVKESIKKFSKFLTETEGSNFDYYTDLIERHKAELSQLESWQLQSPSSKIPTIKTTWEHPVKNGNFLIGFVDMFVSISIPYHLELRNEMSFLPYWDIKDTKKIIIFEVKSVIPSLGEVIRQIRMYEAFVSQAKFIVVSPDNRFESALKSQGIGFIKYEP